MNSIYLRGINLWIFTADSHYRESVSPGNGNLDQVPLGGGSLDPDVQGLEDMYDQHLCSLTAVLTVHWIVHSYC